MSDTRALLKLADVPFDLEKARVLTVSTTHFDDWKSRVDSVKKRFEGDVWAFVRHALNSFHPYGSKSWIKKQIRRIVAIYNQLASATDNDRFLLENVAKFALVARSWIAQQGESVAAPA